MHSAHSRSCSLQGVAQQIEQNVGHKEHAAVRQGAGVDVGGVVSDVGLERALPRLAGGSSVAGPQRVIVEWPQRLWLVSVQDYVC